VHHNNDIRSNFKYTHPPENVAKNATRVTAPEKKEKRKRKRGGE
tara:strand:+ start:555 stop:686 length:132 start_codon:yes stop_codon:yes gene_type:complete